MVMEEKKYQFYITNQNIIQQRKFLIWMIKYTDFNPQKNVEIFELIIYFIRNCNIEMIFDNNH